MSKPQAVSTKLGSVNGVDADALLATMRAIREQKAIARFRFAARNQWQDGAHNRTTIDEFEGALQSHRRPAPFVFDADEPPVLLGQDRGANPVEFLLHALAACVTTSLVYHAALRGIRVRRVESQLDGNLDVRGLLGISDEVRNGYEEIRYAIKVDADASPEQIAELIAVGQARSPVFDMVTHGVPVRVTAAG